MYTLEFDTEIPKICIPIVGTKEEEIIKTAEDLVAAKRESDRMARRLLFMDFRG